MTIIDTTLASTLKVQVDSLQTLENLATHFSVFTREGHSELIIERLTLDDEDVLALCDMLNVTPDSDLGKQFDNADTLHFYA